MTGIAEECPRWQATAGIVGALNREWRHLVEDGSLHYRGKLISWSERHAELRGCHSPADVLVAVRESPDPVLASLLALARDGDELAGRVVLQSMVGRLVGMAHRDTRAGVDDYLAALWCELRTYPLERRPRRIAANLALDTLKAVQREHRWVVRGEVTPWPPGDVLDDIVESARQPEDLDQPGLTDLLDAAQRNEDIDAAARGVLESVYLDGLSSRQAAVRHQTSAGSIRIRCSRAVERLRASAPALLEAA